jgi:ankyrin repeat protein
MNAGDKHGKKFEDRPRVNAKDKDGKTALHCVASSASPSIQQLARFLVEQGADVKATDKDGKTTLHYAARSASPSIEQLARFLIEQGTDVKATDKDGKTALHYIAGSTSPSIQQLARFLVEQGADVKATDKDRETVLHCVAGSASPSAEQLARFLIEQGADVKATDKDGKTALHDVAGSASLSAEQLARFLIEQGADVKAVDKDGKTALHYAAASKSSSAKKTVSALLEKGADVAAKDNEDKTPLHCAAGLSSDSSTQPLNILLEWSAERNIEDNNDMTHPAAVIPPPSTPSAPFEDHYLPVSHNDTFESGTSENVDLNTKTRERDSHLDTRALQEHRFPQDFVLSRLAYSLRLKLSKTSLGYKLLRFYRPKVRSGYKRIEWLSPTGLPMYADLFVSSSSSMQELKVLEAQLQDAATSGDEHFGPRNVVPTYPQAIRTTSSRSAGPNMSATQGSSRENAPQAEGLNSSLDSDNVLSPNPLLFLEFCINTGRHQTELEEIMIRNAHNRNPVGSDRLLFGESTSYNELKTFSLRIHRKCPQSVL